MYAAWNDVGWLAFISRSKDSEALLRESRAEQSAEAALKTQLAEERRKAQDGDWFALDHAFSFFFPVWAVLQEQQRIQEQLEQRLNQRGLVWQDMSCLNCTTNG